MSEEELDDNNDKDLYTAAPNVATTTALANKGSNN
ncbi:hypothetical protein RO3G_10381 [Rhizopus delemar RA 99-880]|uniref:Uncharacterized protein n=1 Tax=Rhizopus delemar (strain RA 99-880 / ATCC MYA-4621 / FGSC 9543 / NRRL 43880) TaxID=246409 RepID=I1CB41_RHIO9|nr:hypothetical protein RO3G_10381 [Rhizopus delemar RA 99-880]|eukprot:EIE85671.1 hypothetical protein RO3G_10381 [Rhizopus delemar RA 99-880]